jgi:hypothetical protein
MKKSIKDLINFGSDIAGTATGALVGLGIAGPPGAIVGAVSGPIISKTIKKIGNEMANRFLTQNEQRRIGAVLIYATKRIEENQKNGLKIREDDFFKDDGKRSTGEEIVEGVLVTAQREHQEKKLPYQGNLLANIAFDSKIDQAQANYLIKLAGTLTYRQQCMLSLIGQKEKFSIDGLQHKGAEFDPRKFTDGNLSLIQELHTMFSQGIVTSEKGGIWVDVLAIRPWNLILKGVGHNLFKLMNLTSMDVIELQSLAKMFKEV